GERHFERPQGSDLCPGRQGSALSGGALGQAQQLRKCMTAQFAVFGAWQTLDEVNASRYLPSLETPADVLDNLRLMERHIRLSNYCGDDLLPESWMRDAERSGLVHAWQRPNREVDLDRRDLFPAAVDDLFDAPRKIDISVLVDVAQVAGAEPIAHKRLCRELWIVEIAAKDERAPDHDLA